ncbi:MAG: hypothetical protein AB7I68_13570 [Porticoccaceae bacterium]
MNRYLAAICIALIGTAAHAAPAQWGSRSVEATPGSPHVGTSIRATVTDPTGDTFGTGTPQHDITSFSADVQGSDMVLTLTFAGTISPPDSGQPDALVGQIDIDRGPSAGDGPGATEAFCPLPGFAGTVDAAVSIFSGTATSADFLDNSTMATTPIVASYTANSATYRIPLAVLNAGATVDFGTVIGTIPEPTDCAPDGAVLSASTTAAAVAAVPVDGRLALLALGLLLTVVAGVALRRA